MPDTAELRFAWVTDRAGFDGLRAEWNSLAAEALRTIFLSHAWLSAWLDEFAPETQLHIMTAWQGDRLVGLLPLCGDADGGGPRRWGFMGAGTLTPNHLDLLAPPDLREAVLALFLGDLLEAADEWDALELDKLPSDTPTLTELEAAFAARGLDTMRSHEAICPCSDLPASYAEYLESRSSRVRKKLRQTLRRYEEEGRNARFVQATTEAEAISALDRLIELHQARWTEKGYPGAFADPRVVRFHHAVVKTLLAENMLRLYELRDGDENVGVSYDFHVADTVQAYLSSFDPKWASWSPGVLMRSFVMEHAIAEGATRFDFLEGREQYKSDWCTCERTNVRLTVFGSSVAAQVAKTKLAARNATVAFARKWVPQSLREAANKTLATRSTSKDAEK